MPCPHDPITYKLPPLLSRLRQLHPPGEFPYDWTINRCLLRCQACDYMGAQKGVMDANDGTVKALKKQLENAEKAKNQDDIEKLKTQLVKAIKKMDEKAEDAMFIYWGIWGKKVLKK